MSEFENSTSATPIFSPWYPPIAYIVRHGETDSNAENLFRGWSNPALNEDGLRACQAIANYFSYERVGRVISSDLDRAMQTAQAIIDCGCVACPYLSTDFNLRPWGIASFTGKEKTAANLKKLDYYVRNPDVKVPPDGESRNDFKNRNRDAILQYLTVPYEGLPTVIVAHTSNLTDLHEMIYEKEGQIIPGADDIVEPGGIVAVYMDATGKMELQVRMGAIVKELEPEAS